MVPPPFQHSTMSTLCDKASRYGGLPTNHRHFQVWRKLSEADLQAGIGAEARLASTPA